MQSQRTEHHYWRRRLSALPVMIAFGLALFGAAGVAWACADVSCQPTWRLGSPAYQCAGQAAISPGNDTRINLLLLMRSLTKAAVKGTAVAQATGDERQFGQTFMSWQGMRAAFWPKPALPADGTSGRSSNCTPPGDFLAQLADERGLPPADREALTRLRAKVGCGAVTWDAAVTSATGREYLAYLKAADAFYAGDWVTARQGFASLTHAHGKWVAETAAYMPIRIGLRAAVAKATGQYGDFDATKVDAAGVAEARATIAAYLKAWPQGRYANSARALTRRVLWLEGNSAGLAHIYEHLLTTTPGEHEAAADLAEEIDLRVFGQDTGESADALTALANTGDTPLLLAVADLKRMRHDETDPKENGKLFPLSAADLAAQAGQFRDNAELAGLLQATRAWYAGEAPGTILTTIPDAARGTSFTPLAFSRQTLRGMALARARDRNEAGFWRDLINGANPLYQRPLVELGLAVRWQHDGQWDQIFAAASPIQDATTRETLMLTVAPPAILRTEARDAARPPHERDIARFTLLYKDLSHAAYGDFGSDVALVPADANLDGGLYSLPRQDRVPVGLFARGNWSDGFPCPPLAGTAAALARSPGDRKAQLCLGDFWRLNGFDSFVLFDKDSHGDALGSGPDAFPGKPVYRDAIYAAIIADRQAAPDIRAYALYRAVMCYAPAGYNGCGQPVRDAADLAAAQAKIPKTMRKAWYNELKATYPDSPWAKSLRYYW